jgi:hypothetical protein
MAGQVLYSAALAGTGLAQKAAVAQAVGPTHLRQIIVCPTGAGSFSLLDGTGGEGKMGTVTFGAAAVAFTIDIPDDGVLFRIGIHAVIAGCTLVFGYG